MAALMLGADTVTLIVRTPELDGDGQLVIDGDGRPTYTVQRVAKTGAKFTIDTVTETPPLIVYNARCALMVDAETSALTSVDAIEHDGKVFELSGDARVKRTLIGGVDHHVRVYCTREEHAPGTGERVTVIPRGGQDDDGRRLPDGTPVDVLAVKVDAGNTARQYGATGTIDAADYTIILPAGSGITDGDWITVRGRRCTARIQREFSGHADRNQDVVLASSRTGGT